MMMMQNLGDTQFAELLSDYAAPVADDGFSAAMLQTIDAESHKVERIRKVSIYSACFIGGAIAATQLSPLLELAEKIDITLPKAAEINAETIPIWGFAGIILLGFVLWVALDRKASDIF